MGQNTSCDHTFLPSNLSPQKIAQQVWPMPFVRNDQGSHPQRGVSDTVACESALRSAGTLLSRVRAPPSAP
ncbi:hypothetical protein PoB_002604800 [Plakobranchus ocellatus]|uniref:Uncharacterized protein n=1 Tax=Plakobranchus ocellatus TaxID=259542 RepID=A0AAV3ZXF4_9GAST|nr:hypothetical protein PoB_002604800 [Plakobranchus ocellatus]